MKEIFNRYIKHIVSVIYTDYIAVLFIIPFTIIRLLSPLLHWNCYQVHSNFTKPDLVTNSKPSIYWTFNCIWHCLYLCIPGEGNGNSLHYSCLENPMAEEPGRLYSPWGCKRSDTTEQLNNNLHTHHFFLPIIYFTWPMGHHYIFFSQCHPLC